MKALRLKETRERRALSQTELAQLAQVARSTVARLEAGYDAHPRTIRKLAEVLRVDPAELQGLD